MLGQIHILGPQMPIPNIANVLNSHCRKGPIAVISAGWRYEEGEIQALTRDIQREVYHLPIYEWFDELGAIEPELAGLHRMRQRRIKAYKKVYQLQLRSALEVWEQTRFLYKKKGAIYDQDEQEACQHVRNIDDGCITRLEEIREDFSALHQPWLHETAIPLFERIAYTFSQCSGIILTGGHVPVLRNRLYFFGLEHLLREALDEGRQIFSWSAGAMTLTDRIVLYYDDPPLGIRHPEILDTGLGLINDTIFLPHASSRLKLSEPERIERFARRFHPATCICLENGAHIIYDEDGVEDLSIARTAFRLSQEGTKLALEDA
jgi:hypothetical protein